MNQKGKKMKPSSKWEQEFDNSDVGLIPATEGEVRKLKQFISRVEAQGKIDVLEGVREALFVKYIEQVATFESITPVEIDQIIDSEISKAEGGDKH